MLIMVSYLSYGWKWANSSQKVNTYSERGKRRGERPKCLGYTGKSLWGKGSPTPGLVWEVIYLRKGSLSVATQLKKIKHFSTAISCQHSYKSGADNHNCSDSVLSRTWILKLFLCWFQIESCQFFERKDRETQIHRVDDQLLVLDSVFSPRIKNKYIRNRWLWRRIKQG